MSKILLNGFRIDPSHTDLEAILLSKMFWYDKINNKIKVGNKELNYYIENDEKYLTTLTQAELPGKNILALEFSILSPI